MHSYAVKRPDASSTGDPFDAQVSGDYPADVASGSAVEVEPHSAQGVEPVWRTASRAARNRAASRLRSAPRTGLAFPATAAAPPSSGRSLWHDRNNPCATVSRRRLDGHQPLPRQRLEVRSHRRTVHRDHVREAGDRHSAVSAELLQDAALRRAQPDRGQGVRRAEVPGRRARFLVTHPSQISERRVVALWSMGHFLSRPDSGNGFRGDAGDRSA